MYIHIPPSGNAFPVKGNDSIIIRNSTSLRGENVFLTNAVTFRTVLKYMGKNSENVISRIYNFLTKKNIRMQYELYE